jgi:probable rRNA maturation factor
VPIDLLIRPGARGETDAGLRARLQRRLRAVLAHLGRARSSATVVLTDDLEIRQLNRDFRRHDRATDVLSFHLHELRGSDDPAGDGVHLGDIVISVQTARRRAAGRRLGQELQRLAIHGLCHLFGHDHGRAAEAAIMFALERRLRRLPVRARDTRRLRPGGVNRNAVPQRGASGLGRPARERSRERLLGAFP